MSWTAARRKPEAADAPTAPSVELGEVFFLLARVKRSLWAAVDARLRAEHGLPLEWFYAMTMLSEHGPAVDEPFLAQGLSIGADEVELLIDALVDAGHLRRREGPRMTAPVSLTFRGSRELARAGRTLEQELARHLRVALSADDLTQFESSLGTMLREARSAAA
jgi:hypothetical protein